MENEVCGALAPGAFHPVAQLPLGGEAEAAFGEGGAGGGAPALVPWAWLCGIGAVKHRVMRAHQGVKAVRLRRNVSYRARTRR